MSGSSEREIKEEKEVGDKIYREWKKRKDKEKKPEDKKGPEKEKGKWQK